MKKNHIIIIATIGVILVAMIVVSLVGPKEATLSETFLQANSINSGTFDIIVNLSDSTNLNLQNLVAKIKGTTDGSRTLFGVTLETGGNAIEMNDLVFIDNNDVFININSLSRIQGKNPTFCSEDDLDKWVHIESTNVPKNEDGTDILFLDVIKSLFNQSIGDVIDSVTFDNNNNSYTLTLDNETLSLICDTLADSIEANSEQWINLLKNISTNSIELSDNTTTQKPTIETTTKKATVEETTSVEMTTQKTTEITEETVTTESTTDIIEETTVEEKTTEKVTELSTTQQSNNTTDGAFTLTINPEKFNDIVVFLRNLSQSLSTPDESETELNDNSVIEKKPDIYTGSFTFSVSEEEHHVFSQNFSIKQNENTNKEKSLIISFIITEKPGIKLTELSKDKILNKEKSNTVISNFVTMLMTNSGNLLTPKYIEYKEAQYEFYQNAIGVVCEESNALFSNKIFFITTSGVVSDIYYVVTTNAPIMRETFLDFYSNQDAEELVFDESMELDSSNYSEQSIRAINYITETFGNEENFLLMRADDSVITQYVNAANSEDELIEYLNTKFN